MHVVHFVDGGEANSYGNETSRSIARTVNSLDAIIGSFQVEVNLVHGVTGRNNTSVGVTSSRHGNGHERVNTVAIAVTIVQVGAYNSTVISDGCSYSNGIISHWYPVNAVYVCNNRHSVTGRIFNKIRLVTRF